MAQKGLISQSSVFFTMSFEEIWIEYLASFAQLINQCAFVQSDDFNLINQTGFAIGFGHHQADTNKQLRRFRIVGNGVKFLQDFGVANGGCREYFFTIVLEEIDCFVRIKDT